MKNVSSVQIVECILNRKVGRSPQIEDNHSLTHSNLVAHIWDIYNCKAPNETPEIA